MSTHHTEQAARGLVMYELARRGYLVQLTDSRFPKADMLVVSPKGKHFGIDIKGQCTENFWQFKRIRPDKELFFAFVFVPEKGEPAVYILTSHEAMKLWKKYKDRIIKNGGKEDGRWGINWTTPHKYLGNWKVLPK